MAEVFRKLRALVMANGNMSWVLDDFSARKYLNLRIDMRMGMIYVSPGNADAERGHHETEAEPPIVGEYEAWIAELGGDTEFCTPCCDRLAEYISRKPEYSAQETGGE